MERKKAELAGSAKCWEMGNTCFQFTNAACVCSSNRIIFLQTPSRNGSDFFSSDRHLHPFQNAAMPLNPAFSESPPDSLSTFKVPSELMLNTPTVPVPESRV